MKRDYPPNIVKFQNAFAKHAEKLIQTNPKDRNADILLRVSEQIEKAWTHEQTKPVESKQTTFLRDYFNDFREVILSCEHFDVLHALAKETLADDKRETIPKVITFWSETYLNEVYIFSCRIKDFLIATERKYNKDTDFAEPIKEICAQSQAIIDKELAPFINVRGSHVHKARSQHSDPQIVRLAHLDLLARDLNQSEFLAERAAAIKEGIEWVLQQISYCANLAWTISDGICDVLSDGIVTENGWLIVPTNHKDQPKLT